MEQFKHSKMLLLAHNSPNLL